MRRLGGAVSVLGLWLSALGLLLPAAPAAATSETFRFSDDFASEDYAGNSGNASFAGPWVEFLDWGGAARGIVEVTGSAGCTSGSCIQFSASDITLYGTGVGRWAQLSDVTSATLRYDYTVTPRGDSDGELRTAVFDGRRWSVLTIHRFGQHDTGSVSFDVSSFANKNFAIGFFGRGDWNGEVAIDNVTIEGSATPATTTTESPSSTPTTAAPATTTTSTPPPVSTTVVATTTTTHPPVTPTTTTTTRPPPSTTQSPQSPTTTSTTTTTAATATTTTIPVATTSLAPVPTTEAAVAPVPPPAPLQAATIQTPTLGLDQNPRYTLKEHLALDLTTDLVTMPERPSRITTTPRPITGITATITTTAVTLRSHLMPTAGLSLVLAGAAVWGLGRRESMFVPNPE